MIVPATPVRCSQTTFATAAIFLLTALTGLCDAADITADAGTFSAVAISPDGRAIAAALDGSKDQSDDPTVVRWWNWNGANGNWPVPSSYRVGAITFTADGSLLVGGKMYQRVPEVQWWRLGAGGAVRTACHDLPIGQGLQRLYPIQRGVASITELTGGQIVTGGIDATLAVWDGCSPTRLTTVETCCKAESPITVMARGTNFVTTGEGGWVDDEHGYKDLGPRRWSPSPWKATPARVRAPTARFRAEGADCTATMDAAGRIAVLGTRPWKASVGAGAWISLAASRDCKTLAVMSERRIVTVRSR